MPEIPSVINGVTVEFAESVVRDVEQPVIDALLHCIKPNLAAAPHTLSRIFISSASDSHEFPSRHVQKKAVDISRINGVKIVIGYPGNASVKAIVDALQVAFESAPKRRENFGPHLKRKLGRPHPVGGHADHIHFSVD